MLKGRRKKKLSKADEQEKLKKEVLEEMANIKKALLLKQLDVQGGRKAPLANVERKESLIDTKARPQTARQAKADPDSFRDYIKFLYETHQGKGAGCK